MDWFKIVMKKAGIFKKIAILVLVLAVPGFLYYLLVVGGKNRYKALPVFGPKSVAKTSHLVKGKSIPDTIYHTLPEFALADQDGRKVTLKSLDDKIFVVDFFYSHCSGVCNLMKGNVGLLLKEYAKNPMVSFATITVDPSRDTVAVLKKYSRKLNAYAPKWLFLTGDTSTIYKLARNGFLVNAVQNSPEDFIYSDKLILIDEQKRIRGYYTGGSTDEVLRLNDEIKVLIAEELLRKEKPMY